MEKDINSDMDFDINSLISGYFSVPLKNINTYSPLALAYIGDSIYDLVVRTVMVDGGNTSVNNLHKSCVKYVSAKAQCSILSAIKDSLSEEELNIVRRGKNTKMHTVAKNATISEYRNATGFEALLGYLYLTGNGERMLQIIKMGVDYINEG